MRCFAKRVLGCVLLAVLAGCKADNAAPPDPVRPVLTVVAAPRDSHAASFAGSVQPRYSVALGFKTLGRIIARDVDVGDVVKRGTRVAAIDPVVPQLAVRAAEADLASASARLPNAIAAEERQRTLLKQGVAAQATVDAAAEARAAAEAAVARAQAALSKAQDILNNTELRADFDGVVTAVEAEFGQVVGAGQTVVTIARPEAREAVVDIPGEAIGEVAPGSPFEVAFQLDPSRRTLGYVREIEPQADPTTRTRRVRIALDDPPAVFRLGATIIATLINKTDASIELPTSALLERDGKTMVWIVDPTSSVVTTHEVRIAFRAERSVQVVDGLAPGDRAVVAGVHSLVPGQRVLVVQEALQ